MPRKVIASLAALALTGWLVPAGATPLSYEWRRSVGISLAAVATDDAGFTVVTGEVRGFEYGRFLVAAFDPDGTRLWHDSWKPIRNEPAGTMGEAVTIGPDGNVYVLGFGWHCRFGCESGGWFIRAYTRDGTLRWARQAAGWKTRPRQSKATGIDSWSGGVVITGYEYADDVGAYVSWIRVYGFDGTFFWKARVRLATATDVRVAAEDVAVGAHGAIFVAGSIEADVGFGTPHDQEPFVVAYDADGDQRWARVVRERGDADDDTATSIDAHDGTLAVGGISGAPIGYGIDPPHLGWLARMSFAGDIRWLRSWGDAWPQSVEHVAVGPGGTVTTVGGVVRRDHARITGPHYALSMRTYTVHGDLIASRVIDPTGGSLVGLGIAIDAGGASLVGASYRTSDLSPGVGGRLWRLG